MTLLVGQIEPVAEVKYRLAACKEKEGDGERIVEWWGDKLQRPTQRKEERPTGKEREREREAETDSRGSDRLESQQRQRAAGLFSVACLLISSPHGLAWPRKLISGTCNTPHPLCWPLCPPTLTASCSHNTNTQSSVVASALPSSTHSLHMCAHFGTVFY